MQELGGIGGSQRLNVLSVHEFRWNPQPTASNVLAVNEINGIRLQKASRAPDSLPNCAREAQIARKDLIVGRGTARSVALVLWVHDQAEAPGAPASDDVARSGEARRRVTRERGACS
jgi:hypothetical protein